MNDVNAWSLANGTEVTSLDTNPRVLVFIIGGKVDGLQVWSSGRQEYTRMGAVVVDIDAFLLLESR